jgi:hypothetical protein
LTKKKTSIFQSFLIFYQSRLEQLDAAKPPEISSRQKRRRQQKMKTFFSVRKVRPRPRAPQS